jgi:hypothetical protein
MKQSTKAVVVGLALALSSGPALAQTFIFSADENGNGTYIITTTPPPTVGPLRFELIPDPTGGVSGNVLAYILPFQVTPGDVELMDPGSPSVPSDLIRFLSGIGPQSLMIFYSQNDGPPTTLADTGLPTPNNPVQIPEVENGSTPWDPTPGQTGSPLAPMAGICMYNFVSNSPEPGTIAMMLMGAGGLVLFRKFKR